MNALRNVIGNRRAKPGQIDEFRDGIVAARVIIDLRFVDVGIAVIFHIADPIICLVSLRVNSGESQAQNPRGLENIP